MHRGHSTCSSPLWFNTDIFQTKELALNSPSPLRQKRKRRDVNDAARARPETTSFSGFVTFQLEKPRTSVKKLPCNRFFAERPIWKDWPGRAGDAVAPAPRRKGAPGAPFRGPLYATSPRSRPDRVRAPFGNLRWRWRWGFLDFRRSPGEQAGYLLTTTKFSYSRIQYGDLDINWLRSDMRGATFQWASHVHNAKKICIRAERGTFKNRRANAKVWYRYILKCNVHNNRRSPGHVSFHLLAVAGGACKSNGKRWLSAVTKQQTKDDALFTAVSIVRRTKELITRTLGKNLEKTEKTPSYLL